MMKWSDDAFAGYLAAMIDGEGHIEIITGTSVRVRIANTVKSTLDALARRLEVGRVVEYKRPKDSGYKRLYCLDISNARDVRAVFDVCGNFIHMKRDQMQRALLIVNRVLAEVGRIDERNKAILAALNANNQNQNAIAKKFGVSPQLVSFIKNGHTWSCIISGHRARALNKKFPKDKNQVFRLHGEP